MGLPQLESCCFILDLKTGNIVVGCFNAMMSFAMVIVFIVVAASLGVEVNQMPTNVPMDIEKEAALTGVYVMSIILTLMFIGKFLFDVYFIYGVVMERAGIIKANFIMWLVFFLLSMFTFFINVSHYSGGTIAYMVFYLGLNLYVCLLSYSFYKQLNMREVI